MTGISLGRAVTTGPGMSVCATRKARATTVFISDAGNFGASVHRHRPWRPLLLDLIGGAMDFGMPAAAAAVLRLPWRQELTFVGDGGMLMTNGELATAIHEGAPL